MRGRSGLVPGFEPAGLLVFAEAGGVEALVVVGVVPAGAVVLAAPLAPGAAPGAPLFGVDAGAGVGNEVNGVGSGGNGFVTTAATY